MAPKLKTGIRMLSETVCTGWVRKVESTALRWARVLLCTSFALFVGLSDDCRLIQTVLALYPRMLYFARNDPG